MTMQPGVMRQLGVLVASWERGVSAIEYLPYEFWDKKKWKVMRRACRRSRILVGLGYADQVRALQTGYEAYRVNARGLALWDQHLLDLLA